MTISLSPKLKNHLYASIALLFTWITSQAMAQAGFISVEYDANSEGWFIANGFSVLRITNDDVASWEAFISPLSVCELEVLGSTLYAMTRDVEGSYPETYISYSIHAFDALTSEHLGSTEIEVTSNTSSWLSGMGSQTSELGSFLVTSDRDTGRLLRIDVSNPNDMVVSTLLESTGTQPTGVAIQSGKATVVSQDSDDIIQVDIATGEISTLISGHGLGALAGVDWANGSLIVSSNESLDTGWNSRITRLTTNPSNPSEWYAETIIQGSDLTSESVGDLSVNEASGTFAVVNGTFSIYFGQLEEVSSQGGALDINCDDLTASPNPTRGKLTLTIPQGFIVARIQWFDATGRALGEMAGASFRGQLDLSEWGSGMRYVTVTSLDGLSYTRRVMVQ